jgi:hypothetical protein
MNEFLFRLPWELVTWLEDILLECCYNQDHLYLQSLKNSYVEDVYDQLLTQAEVQDHLSNVNGENADSSNLKPFFGFSGCLFLHIFLPRLYVLFSILCYLLCPSYPDLITLSKIDEKANN